MRVPESIERGRIRSGPYGSGFGDGYGAFIVIGPQGEKLCILASPGDANEGIPWEHVSVSTKTRCPTWKEMCWVKDLFWSPEEAVMQLHPPKSDWVNNHNYCLHLWHPQDGNIPLPPSVAVGYKALNVKRA